MPDLPRIFIASSGQKRLEIRTWRKVKAGSDGATELGGRSGAVRFLALFLCLLQFLETAWREGGLSSHSGFQAHPQWLVAPFMSRKRNHCSRKGCDGAGNHGPFLMFYLQETSGIYRSNEIGRTKKKRWLKFPSLFPLIFSFFHSFGAFLKPPKRWANR